MTRDLSCALRWDILWYFYRDFDNGCKRGCVEKWKKEMPAADSNSNTWARTGCA